VQFFCQTCRGDDRRQISAVALLAQVADADSPVRSARRWPQRIAPHPPPALGSMTISTVPGPVLRDLGNGTGDRDKTQVPSGHREGDRGPRAALIIRTDRTREI
jgi:hypothetical protein